MTPHQTTALCAAHLADTRGGLAYTVGGWIDPDQPQTYYQGQVVTALVSNGYLAETGKGNNRRSMITQQGREAVYVATSC